MSFQIKTAAYKATNMPNFHGHKTVMFGYIADNYMDISRYLAVRSGFSEPPAQPRARHINIAMHSTGWANSARADLVVTDSPQDVYGYIDMTTIQQWFKLPELQELGQDILGNPLAGGWSDIRQLQPEQRARLLTQPIINRCQVQRKSEQELLGYKRLSWEEFARDYTAIVSDYEVQAFPRQQVDSYLLYSPWNDTEPAAALIFGEHRQDGETLCWIQDMSDLTNFFNPRQRTGNLFRADDYLAIDQALHKLMGNQQNGPIKPGIAKMPFDQAPSLLRKMEVTHFFPSQQYDLPTLTTMARDELNLRGYSSKTKAELSIMIGEHLSTIPAQDPTPALIFSNQSEIEDLAPIDAAVEQRGRDAKPLDYYTYVGRVISGRAYVPGSEASPAGRIPTDGSFGALFGVAPLDVLNPEL